MSRSIINRSGGRSIVNRTGGVISVICDLPLTLVNTNSIQNTINLGGLNSYGGAGKIIKVNSSNDGLIYADDNNTEYTAGTNINISNNAISSDQKTTLTFNSGAILRGIGSSTNIREIAQVNGSNDVIFGDINNNVGFATAQGLFYKDDSLALITKTRIGNLSGINMASGDIINFNGEVADDLKNTIGSNANLGGVYLQGASIVKIGTEGLNANAIFSVKTDKINCKGKLTGQFTYNGTERDLLQLTENESIQLGDVNTNITYVCSGGLYMNSVVNLMLRANGKANLQGLDMDAGNINMTNGTIISFNGIVDNPSGPLRPGV